MSMMVIGLALGLNGAASADKVEMNPHILAADRQYQELIYQNRRVLDAGELRRKSLVMRERKRRIRAAG